VRSFDRRAGGTRAFPRRQPKRSHWSSSATRRRWTNWGHMPNWTSFWSRSRPGTALWPSCQRASWRRSRKFWSDWGKVREGLRR